jgi:hypothetical protein
VRSVDRSLFLKWVRGEENLTIEQMFESPRPVFLTADGQKVSTARRNKAGKVIEESLKWRS